MKATLVLLATLAGLGFASPARQDLYLSGDKPSAPAKAAPDTMSTQGNTCTQCAQYCTSASNGAALSAACLIVKCGIQCLVG